MTQFRQQRPTLSLKDIDPLHSFNDRHHRDHLNKNVDSNARYTVMNCTVQ
ncbi:hypothetical protein [Mycobacterium canetti]|nr:hypothetical protein [Mycobacterium canetti]